MFLNIYHLIFANGRRSHYKQNRAFPWVVWQIWKARNLLHFEKMQLSPEMVHSNASEEAVAWFDVNLCEPQPGAGSGEACNRSISWSPPPVGSVKWNVGVSWGGPERLCGASWIIRNQAGRVLMHSRRAFTGVKSKLEAELTGFCWVAESLASLHYSNIIIESICALVREALLDKAKFPWFSELDR